ncbi:nucleotidyl transferase AbiEii/AbiGii toxin family protein [Thermomonospora catenispora]|uniref:nucleotidyl transferase AbiEii/AbiGii toxin family protein n=1 Tax=Thermomonospora catenispora TaxID=2493090 RepID=UPI0019D59827
MDALETVQQWPEAAEGAAAYEMWRDEEFDTGGLHPALPPEGLHYVLEPLREDPGIGLYEELIRLLTRRPEAAPGVLVDPASAERDVLGGYYRLYNASGVRLVISWQAEGLPPGRVQLDFARDEWLPEAPVPAAVPRADGGEPSVVPAAGPELSLAWKLLWLHTDRLTERRCRGKDLYDAVLLAEAERTALSRPLLEKVFRRALGPGSAGLDPSSILRWEVDWRSFQATCPPGSGDGRGVARPASCGAGPRVPLRIAGRAIRHLGAHRGRRPHAPETGPPRHPRSADSRDRASGRRCTSRRRVERPAGAGAFFEGPWRPADAAERPEQFSGLLGGGAEAVLAGLLHGLRHA